MTIFITIFVWSFIIDTVVFAVQVHSRPILYLFVASALFTLLLLLVGKWSGLLALLKTSARRLHPTFSDPLNLKLHSFKVSEQWGRHFEKLLKNTGPADQPVPQNYGSSEMAKPVRRVLILDRQSGPEKMAQG